MDAVLNGDNYAALPRQEMMSSRTAAPRKPQMSAGIPLTIKINKKKLKTSVIPRGAAKYTKTAVEAFTLFFTKSIIKNVVCYTNTIIQPAIERFSDLFE